VRVAAITGRKANAPRRGQRTDTPRRAYGLRPGSETAERAVAIERAVEQCLVFTTSPYRIRNIAKLYFQDL